MVKKENGLCREQRPQRPGEEITESDGMCMKQKEAQ